MTLQSQCRGVPFRPCAKLKCRRDAWDGFKRCPGCLLLQRLYAKKHREKRLEYLRGYNALRRGALRVRGLCRECGQRSTLALSYYCEECKIVVTINKDRRALASV